MIIDNRFSDIIANKTLLNVITVMYVWCVCIIVIDKSQNLIKKNNEL